MLKALERNEYTVWRSAAERDISSPEAERSLHGTWKWQSSEADFGGDRWTSMQEKRAADSREGCGRVFAGERRETSGEQRRRTEERREEGR